MIIGQQRDTSVINPVDQEDINDELSWSEDSRRKSLMNPNGQGTERTSLIEPFEQGTAAGHQWWTQLVGDSSRTLWNNPFDQTTRSSHLQGSNPKNVSSLYGIFYCTILQPLSNSNQSWWLSWEKTSSYAFIFFHGEIIIIIYLSVL